MNTEREGKKNKLCFGCGTGNLIYLASLFTATILFSLFLMFSFVRIANAQVLINEFSSSTTSDDWIELYSPENTDISGYILKDSTGVMKTISTGTSIGPATNGYYVIDVNNRLNNSGDEITLLSADGTTQLDKIVYGGQGNVCSPAPDGSIGRFPDGGNTVDKFLTATKGTTNNTAILNPCAAPTSEPTQQQNSPVPTATVSPTSTGVIKGTYKINDTRNANGIVLQQVKIYIDGVYVHHYTPEKFDFCSGCKCDSVSCNFGYHEFRIEKEGYNDWSSSKTINANNFFEVNPVMTAVTPSDIPTRAPTSTSAPTSAAIGHYISPTKQAAVNNEPAENNLVLGVKDQPDDSLPATVAAQTIEKMKNVPKISFLFIAAGILFMFSSFVLVIKNKSSLYNKDNEIYDDGKIDEAS